MTSDAREALRRDLRKDRLQVQLSRAQVAELRSRARERGISVSALVREAVERSLQEPPGPTRAELHKRAERFFGKNHGPSDMSENHDKYIWGGD